MRPPDINESAVTVDHTTHTMRPAHDAGDAYFGLETGTNGTAAISRRAWAEYVHSAQGYRWVRHNGKPATGVLLIPSGKEATVSTWGGES